MSGRPYSYTSPAHKSWPEFSAATRSPVGEKLVRSSTRGPSNIRWAGISRNALSAELILDWAAYETFLCNVLDTKDSADVHDRLLWLLEAGDRKPIKSW